MDDCPISQEEKKWHSTVPVLVVVQSHRNRHFEDPSQSSTDNCWYEFYVVVPWHGQLPCGSVCPIFACGQTWGKYYLNISPCLWTWKVRRSLQMMVMTFNKIPFINYASSLKHRGILVKLLPQSISSLWSGTSHFQVVVIILCSAKLLSHLHGHPLSFRNSILSRN